MKNNTALVKRIGLIVAVVIVGIGSYCAGNAALFGTVVGGFTPAQHAEIENTIHQYIVDKHPEVLMEASQALQTKQTQSIEKKGVDSAKRNTDALFRNSDDPVGGNPKGDVTLVEFFDYQCMHCREMTAIVDHLIKTNDNLRVVYKEFPIFGTNSTLEAKAAMAANKQGKYQEMHDALMTSTQQPTQNNLINIAENIGLDVSEFKSDMNDRKLDTIILNNHHLGQQLGIQGTPGFFIAKTDTQDGDDANIAFIPGQASEEDVQHAIDQVQ